ncbi:MAG: DUF3368 domain-containing protein [Chloroflexi bacterium]|nr:DUF3368 domain-containing protein [Chloroflexota bacterium]
MNAAKTVVCNTTLLSNFAAAKRTELLTRALDRPLCTTPEVVSEISDGVQAGYSHLNALETSLLGENSPLQIVSLEPKELVTFRELRLRLHAGEASCLAIALHRHYVLGTDDLAARKLAKAKGVDVIGTVGALILARKIGLSLAEANSILQEMIDTGYRSPVKQLDEFWK